jgi:hypothetical protein
MRHGTGVRVRNAEEARLFATQQVAPRLAGYAFTPRLQAKTRVKLARWKRGLIASSALMDKIQ